MKKMSFLLLFISQLAWAGVAHPTLGMLVSYDPNHKIGVKEKTVVYERLQALQDFYQNMSYGNVNIQSELQGPYVISKPEGCDPHGDGAHVDAQANVKGFDHKMYLYGDVESSKYVNAQCKWVGLGSYGAPVTQAWIAYHDSGAQLYEHEYGHNLGLHHAASGDPDCVVSKRAITDESPWTPLAGQCNEYGDPTDVMGHGKSLNGPHRVQAGWLQAQKVSESGTYTLTSLDLQEATVLTFPKPDTGDDYYLSNLDGKIHVHRWKSGQLSQTVLVKSLAEGEEFQDEANGISFYVPLAGQVEVSFDADARCKRGSPKPIGIAPGYQYAKAGDKTLIQVILTNHDSKECKPTTFKLSSRVPADVSYSYPVNEVKLKPGESKWLDLNLSVSGDSKPGQKSIWVDVTGAVQLHNAYSMGVVEVK